MEVRYGPGEQFADDVSDEDLEAAAAFVDGLIAKRRVAIEDADLAIREEKACNPGRCSDWKQEQADEDYYRREER